MLPHLALLLSSLQPLHHGWDVGQRFLLQSWVSTSASRRTILRGRYAGPLAQGCLSKSVHELPVSRHPCLRSPRLRLLVSTNYVFCLRLELLQPHRSLDTRFVSRIFGYDARVGFECILGKTVPHCLFTPSPKLRSFPQITIMELVGIDFGDHTRVDVQH